MYTYFEPDNHIVKRVLHELHKAFGVQDFERFSGLTLKYKQNAFCNWLEKFVGGAKL